jgi:hypothetical protein
LFFYCFGFVCFFVFLIICWFPIKWSILRHNFRGCYRLNISKKTIQIIQKSSKDPPKFACCFFPRITRSSPSDPRHAMTPLGARDEVDPQQRP